MSRYSKMFSKIIIKHVYIWRSFVHLNTNLSYLKSCRLLCGNSSPDTNAPILLDRYIDFFKRDTRYSLFVVHCSETEMTPCIMNALSNDMSVEQIIGKVTAVKLPSFLQCLYVHKHAFSAQEMKRILLVVDNVYSKNIPLMDKESVLRCVHVWYNLCEGRTVPTKIYQEFLQTTSIWLTKRNNSLELLVYIMFYIGISKKFKTAQSLIKKCLSEIDTYVNLLSLDELCIISNSSYKCSVQIKSAKLLQCICNSMERNFETLVSDPGYIATFVKVLRFAKCYNFNIMDGMISNEHSSNRILEMNFTTKVHILAMYAGALYDKKYFVKTLIQSCIEDTNPSYEKSKNYPALRMKDISRLLWAVSFLGYSLPYQELKVIINELHKFVNKNKYETEAEHIVGSLLSLWAMGHRESVLFKTAIGEPLMKILLEKHPFRIQARLSLLFTCVQIEMPELLCEEHLRWETRNIIPSDALEKHFYRRIFLKHIFTAVSNLGQHMKLHVICGCYVSNLNILGITITSPSGNVLHIEVLDAEVCLHNTYIPHGLMKLKIRLLKNMGHHVLVIRDNKYDLERNASEMYIFLEEKLAKLQNRRGV